MSAMEEGIDLGAGLRVFLKYWKWILGITVAAAGVGLTVSLRLPFTYEATALVTIKPPLYVMNFDTRFQPVIRQLVYKTHLDLAEGDEVLETLFSRLNPRPAGIKTLRNLRGMVKAREGADPSVVRLTVRARNPQEAARIVNLWAEVFVAHMNQIYGSSDEELQRLEGQLAQAQAALEAAEQALIEFQARNQASILEARLNSLKNEQAYYLTQQQSITYILQDLRAFRERLVRQPGEQPASLADDLTAILLQIKAFNAQTSTPIQLQVNSAESLSHGSIGETMTHRSIGETMTLLNAQAFMPIQLQVNSAESLSHGSIGETMTLLNDIGRALEAKSVEIRQRLEELQPQILSLQRRLQETRTESDRLTRQRDLAKETYTALARKVQERRIAIEGIERTAQLGSRAAVPEEPASPRRLLNTVVAGMLGLVFSTIGVFVAEWWRNARAGWGSEKAASDGAGARSLPALPESR
jgi:uncharacterized protein involved in exopolysaccharide biosynthesis